MTIKTLVDRLKEIEHKLPAATTKERMEDFMAMEEAIRIISMCEMRTKSDKVTLLNEILAYVEHMHESDFVKVKYIRQFCFDKFRSLDGEKEQTAADD